NPSSVIIAPDLTFTLENMVKIMGWYDNEWGYSHRLVDMAQFIYHY
ncbi:type I glyceraldehyde-3-phosphate dehydrogenase, partial [Helicobacter pylori]